MSGCIARCGGGGIRKTDNRRPPLIEIRHGKPSRFIDGETRIPHSIYLEGVHLDTVWNANAAEVWRKRLMRALRGFSKAMRKAIQAP